VVSDPRRRKIVGALMILGNVVLVTVISLMVGSFATIKGLLSGLLTPLLLIVGGYVLYRVLMTRTVAKRWSTWVGEKFANRLRVTTRGVHEILALAEGYGVAEIGIEAYSPAAGKTLAEAGLRQAGLLVLAIRQRDRLVPNPTADIRIEAGNHLICYGELERMMQFANQAPAKPPAGEDPGKEPPAPDIISLLIPDERDEPRRDDDPAPGRSAAGAPPEGGEPRGRNA
jgi:hypothetical protein